MTSSQALYRVAPLKPGDVFGLHVRRAQDNATLFDSSGSSLAFKAQYLELSTALQPTASLYGLGGCLRGWSRGDEEPGCCLCRRNGRGGGGGVRWWGAPWQQW